MFRFTYTKIPDVQIIEPEVFWDERGFFTETYSKKEFHKAWIDADFVQDNHSKSTKWVLRWLHFQTINSQAKLVRVVSWSVYDVVVDLRKKSSTYWKWIWEVLSAENKKQLFVPRWFAHWFLTLENNTEFVYKCDNYYNPQWDGWIFYNDTDIWIDWHQIMNRFNIQEVLLSEKDKNHKWIKEFSSSNPF